MNLNKGEIAWIKDRIQLNSDFAPDFSIIRSCLSALYPILCVCEQNPRLRSILSVWETEQILETKSQKRNVVKIVCYLHINFRLLFFLSTLTFQRSFGDKWL